MSDADPSVPGAPTSAPSGGQASGDETSTKHGPGRVLIIVYAVLAIAATSRSMFELATKFSQAPIPYVLSTFAAVVYLVITVALVRDTPTWRRVAFAGMVVELAGVLIVGVWSVVHPDTFTNTLTGKPVHSVWFWFGLDYVLIPLVLPVLGLRFLWRTRRA